MPKTDSCCIYFSIILFDSIFQSGKNYCPQFILGNVNTFSKEERCKDILIVVMS